jgi:lipopolysaccharide/colanic/teichoic acid biosynthesis glycosyltransferase
MKEIGFESQPAAVPGETHNWRRIKYRHVKRALDIFLSLNFLMIAGPFMLLIALGIKLHSPGPVFYRQKRIGRYGRPFDMLKSRSMRLGSDSGEKGDIHRQYMLRLIREDIGPCDLGCQSLKLAADPRITGLGHILRKYSLDELPQFINVLRGEMSIVGPRPPLPYEYDLYSEHDKLRLDVTPGMTGLWQVTAHNQVSFSEMVQIDLGYIKNCSLWLDLKIIVLTPIEMFRGKGAG